MTSPGTAGESNPRHRAEDLSAHRLADPGFHHRVVRGCHSRLRDSECPQHLGGRFPQSENGKESPFAHVGEVFHGTRRTAVTNLVEGGRVPRSVAKTISGHSTDSRFTRYGIPGLPVEANAEPQS